jgi:hypothetical protein
MINIKLAEIKKQKREINNNTADIKTKQNGRDLKQNGGN